MADRSLNGLFESAKQNPRCNGKFVACDNCGKLHYRKLRRLTRNQQPARAHPTSGLFLCSKDCYRQVESKSHVVQPCLNCGKDVFRRRSQVKKRVFCSRECADGYGVQLLPCCWPGCDNKVSGRVFTRRQKNRQVVEFKTELTKLGSACRTVLCKDHRDILERYCGNAARITNGRVKLLRDPAAVYDVRAASSRFLRAVVFERASGECQNCRRSLSFHNTSWQVDHIVPIFRGGVTSITNLQILCEPCHVEKTAPEKAEASRLRHSLSKVHRWRTHRQKDDAIEILRRQIIALGHRPVA